MTTTAMSTAAGATGVGCWVKLPAPESVELLALAGADFVVVDLANSSLTVDHVAQHLIAARAGGVPCWVRLPDEGPPSLAGRLLDAGAHGVIVPHVETVAQASSFVAAAYFPPEGTRGMGGTTRGGRWLLDGLQYYLGSARRADRTPPVSLMVETAAALDSVDELAAIDGLAQLFVGPADLSVALGVPGQMSHPHVLSGMDRVVEAARQHGRSVATATGSAESARALFAKGFDAIVVGNDAGLLGTAAAHVFTESRPTPA